MSVVSELTKKLFSGIDEAGQENIERLIKNRFGDVVSTEEAAMGIKKNINDLKLNPATAKEDELFAGITGASEYKGNILTQAFNTNAGAFSTLGMGAAVGAIGATATGGDYREGAALGAAVGMGIAGAGKAIMKNIGSVEDNFMNSLLRGKTTTAPAQEPVSISSIARGLDKETGDVTFRDLKNAGLKNKTMGEIMGLDDDGVKALFSEQNLGSTTLEQYKKGFNTPIKKLSDVDDVTMGVNFNNIDPDNLLKGFSNTNTVTTSKEIPLSSSKDRAAKLRAVENLTADELKKAGLGAQYKQDVLMGRKDLNVAQATRMSGFIGTALTGMAFSSKRRDHRRGFNKRRGNRV